MFQSCQRFQLNVQIRLAVGVRATPQSDAPTSPAHKLASYETRCWRLDR